VKTANAWLCAPLSASSRRISFYDANKPAKARTRISLKYAQMPSPIRPCIRFYRAVAAAFIIAIIAVDSRDNKNQRAREKPPEVEVKVDASFSSGSAFYCIKTLESCALCKFIAIWANNELKCSWREKMVQPVRSRVKPQETRRQGLMTTCAWARV
jgi:hypothetical protein